MYPRRNVLDRDYLAWDDFSTATQFLPANLFCRVKRVIYKMRIYLIFNKLYLKQIK